MREAAKHLEIPKSTFFDGLNRERHDYSSDVLAGNKYGKSYWAQEPPYRSADWSPRKYDTAVIPRVSKDHHGTMRSTKSANTALCLDGTYRMAIFDIESTSLKGDFGIILCCVMKEYGTDNRYIFQIDINDRDLLHAEKEMLLDIKDCIDGFDVLAGYYSTKFDSPMLRTRMLYHGIIPFEKIKHLDVYYTVKRIINTTSRRMERIGDLLRTNMMPDLPQKTKLDINEWIKVVHSRDRNSLGYIVDHCIADVDMLEGIINEIKPFLPDKIVRS